MPHAHEAAGDPANVADARPSVSAVVRAVEPESGAPAIEGAHPPTPPVSAKGVALPADGGRPGSWQPAASTEVLRATITTIIALFPAWGVRKVWATMRRPP